MIFIQAILSKILFLLLHFYCYISFWVLKASAQDQASEPEGQEATSTATPYLVADRRNSAAGVVHGDYDDG